MSPAEAAPGTMLIADETPPPSGGGAPAALRTPDPALSASSASAALADACFAQSGVKRRSVGREQL